MRRSKPDLEVAGSAHIQFLDVELPSHQLGGKLCVDTPFAKGHADVAFAYAEKDAPFIGIDFNVARNRRTECFLKHLVRIFIVTDNVNFLTTQFADNALHPGTS